MATYRELRRRRRARRTIAVRRCLPGGRRLADDPQRLRGSRAGTRRHRHPRPGLRRPPDAQHAPAGSTCGPTSGTCAVPSSSCGSVIRPTRCSTAARAVVVPEDSPGRGVTGTKHHFLVAAPRLARADRRRAARGRARPRWSKSIAPPGPATRHRAIKLLPAEVPYEDSTARAARGARAWRSVWQNVTSSPVRLDFASPMPNFLAARATPAPGKSGFLRTLARRIRETYTPDQARIVVIDHRRSLLGACRGRPPDRLRHQPAGVGRPDRRRWPTPCGHGCRDRT